jgi:hypothetical protein
MAYVSRDGRWRVTRIVLDGRELLRVEADHPVMPVGEPRGCTGPIQLAGGCGKQADVANVSQVEQYVPLHELEEATA